MRFILLALACILLSGCFPTRYRNVWGNGEEIVNINVIPQDRYNRDHGIGEFNITQYRRFWANDLTYADMTLTYRNTTHETLTFQFNISFNLQRWNQRYRTSDWNRNPAKYDGNFVYTNSVVRVPPGESVSFGKISEQLVNLNQGTVIVRVIGNTVERN